MHISRLETYIIPLVHYNYCLSVILYFFRVFYLWGAADVCLGAGIVLTCFWIAIVSTLNIIVFIKFA